MDYYNHPAMSRSKLVDLDKMTPYKWYCKHIKKSLPQKTTKALDFGSAFHCYVLERDKYDELYTVEPKVDKRTKQGKEDHKLFNEANKGKTVLTVSDNEMLSDMLYSLSHHKANKIINSCDSKEEEFYFNLEGVEFRAKLDAVNTKKNIIFDVKTCRESFLSGKHFAQEMINHHNAEQVFIYSEAYRQKYGTNPKFYFICVEKQAPFEVQIFDASCLYEYGYKKTLELIAKYKQLSNNFSDDEWIDDTIQISDLPYYAEKYLTSGDI